MIGRNGEAEMRMRYRGRYQKYEAIRSSVIGGGGGSQAGHEQFKSKMRLPSFMCYIHRFLDI